MAKIDEITEILINEIEAFNKSVEKLQKERIEFQNVEFIPDITPINDILQNHLKEFKEYYQKQNQVLSNLKNDLKKTVIIPKWMTVSFISFFFIIIINLTYSFYQHQQIKEREQKAYNEGIEAMRSHIQQFFNENPKAKNSYDEWKKE